MAARVVLGTGSQLAAAETWLAEVSIQRRSMMFERPSDDYNERV